MEVAEEGFVDSGAIVGEGGGGATAEMAEEGFFCGEGVGAGGAGLPECGVEGEGGRGVLVFSFDLFPFDADLFLVGLDDEAGGKGFTGG